MVVGLVLVGGLATHGCRQHRIDACVDNGGTPNVPSWFVEDPADVRCIYGLSE